MELRGYNLSFFFFSSRRRHTRSTRDWSSDVCSSDLRGNLTGRTRAAQRQRVHAPPCHGGQVPRPLALPPPADLTRVGGGVRGTSSQRDMPCRRRAATTSTRAAGPPRASHGHGIVDRHHRNPQAGKLKGCLEPRCRLQRAHTHWPSHSSPITTGLASGRESADAMQGMPIPPDPAMAEAANPETRLATRPISNLKPAHRPLALPVSLVRTVALRCPAVVGRVPARQVPAVHASWPLAAPRFDRSSKLPSLHCDRPRCRPWLAGCHRRGLLLLAHVRPCSFAFAATWAPAGERTGASIRLRHVGLRCCGRRGRRQARWPFLSELGPIPLWPLGLAADSSPAATGGERRPRTPAGDDGDGWGRAGGKVGGGYSSPPRRQPPAPPRLPGRSSRTSTSFARCRAQRPLHTTARSAYPAAGCSSPRASHFCAVRASPDSKRASCAMEFIPTSVKQSFMHAVRVHADSASTGRDKCIQLDGSGRCLDQSALTNLLTNKPRWRKHGRPSPASEATWNTQHNKASSVRRTPGHAKPRREGRSF